MPARDSRRERRPRFADLPQLSLPGPVDYPWLHAPAAEVAETARTLLGWELAAGGVRIRLTEVEAYAGTGEDPASHAHRGPTPRTRVMFGPAGHAYTYFVFGMHWCLNIVCGGEGEAAAVLLRAGAVVDGLPIARERRGTPPTGTWPGGRPGWLSRSASPRRRTAPVCSTAAARSCSPRRRHRSPGRPSPPAPGSAWPPPTTCRGVSGSPATRRSAPTAGTCPDGVPDPGLRVRRSSPLSWRRGPVVGASVPSGIG